MEPPGKPGGFSLETYRKDGTAARTPLWCVDLDDDVRLWTGAESYKVKRLRNNPKGRLAACNASGKKILGEWVEVEAEIFEAQTEVDRVVAAFAKKYTWQMWLIRLTLPFRRGVAGKYVSVRLRPLRNTH